MGLNKNNILSQLLRDAKQLLVHSCWLCSCGHTPAEGSVHPRNIERKTTTKKKKTLSVKRLGLGLRNHAVACHRVAENDSRCMCNHHTDYETIHFSL